MSSRRLDPHVFVIFGGTGDLTKRKLLPALASLAARGQFPGDSAILSVSRDKTMDDAGYREWVGEPLPDGGTPGAAMLEWCDECVFYQPIGEGTAEEYAALGKRIAALEKKRGLPGNRVFYLALPPAAFPSTIERLGEAKLNSGPGWTRLVVEKPFGRDLESARKLNALVHSSFDESQVYRIDHYLGKETVQNLLVFRFANPLFESVWGRDRVASVHITVAESVGVGHRAGYYDRAGVIRDMVQNHLTQLLSLVATEVPAAFVADDIRAEKIKVLRNVRPIGRNDIVLGQYTTGMLEGDVVAGYHDEDRVPADSRTATYAALRLRIDNWRWQGVPFYLRTGKRLPLRSTRIDVVFQHPPVAIFAPYDCGEPGSNVLTITVQPNEGFWLNFEVKKPGEGIDLTTQKLHFEYAEVFGGLPEAYETLLLDVIAGDQTLFVHAGEVEASWQLYDPLLSDLPDPEPYSAGSWGPEAADALLHEEGSSWRVP